MPDLPDKKILDLISSFYEMADQSSLDGWKDLYLEIAKLTNARSGTLNLYVEKREEYGPIAGTFPDEFISAYNEHYHSVNPFKNAVTRMSAGQRFNRQEAMSDDEFYRTSFYNDYYRKFDIFHFEHQVFMVDDGLAFGLSLTRSERDGNFSNGELKLLEYLMPHLQRAFGLYLRVCSVSRRSDMFAAVIDRIPRGVLAVDANHKIIFANRAAEDILRHPECGLAARQSKLSAPISANDRKLKMVLKTVFDPGAVLRSNEAGLVQFERESGKPPLQLFVTPIAERHFRFDGGQKLALIFITDPEQSSERAAQVLKDFYGLTPAEVRLATMIADGQTLFAASEILNVSMNTVRTHLKRIFAKTRTNRQSELMRLITTGPASLRNFEENL
ncbi:MAG: LuxR C-terminal-related transcriptional regulator [Acidobacteriota bacterium]